MTDLMPFSYEGQQVRTVMVNGEPWFVAADVAAILGYRMASDMTRRLDEDEKGYAKVRTPGGEQQMAVTNESGLYHAVFGSQVVGAVRFRRRLRDLKVLAAESAHVLAGVSRNSGDLGLTAVVDEHGIDHLVYEAVAAGFERLLSAVVGASGIGKRIAWGVGGGHVTHSATTVVANSRWLPTLPTEVATTCGILD